jgi:hypothetical protein
VSSCVRRGLRSADLNGGQRFECGIESLLISPGKASQRQRDLPAHVVVYYVIALALFTQVSCREVLRCLLEGLA